MEMMQRLKLMINGNDAKIKINESVGGKF